MTNNKKTPLIQDQINYFIPHTEENFIEISSNIKDSPFAVANFHYFIPHRNINLDNTDELKDIITPSEDIKQFITIDDTQVTRDDILITFSVGNVIEGKGEHKKYKGLSGVLEIASKYFAHLSEKTGKKSKGDFISKEDDIFLEKIKELLKFDGLFELNAINIDIDVEYDMSASIGVIINKKAIKLFKDSKDIVSEIEKRNTDLIYVEDLDYRGTNEEYIKIGALSDYVEVEEGVEIRTKQNLIELADALINELKVLTK